MISEIHDTPTQLKVYQIIKTFAAASLEKLLIMTLERFILQETGGGGGRYLIFLWVKF